MEDIATMLSDVIAISAPMEVGEDPGVRHLEFSVPTSSSVLTPKIELNWLVSPNSLNLEIYIFFSKVLQNKAAVPVSIDEVHS